jgi:hypothetical protein
MLGVPCLRSNMWRGCAADELQACARLAQAWANPWREPLTCIRHANDRLGGHEINTDDWLPPGPASTGRKIRSAPWVRDLTTIASATSFTYSDPFAAS